MGFICEKYLNNQAGLIVAFQGENNTENYFAGNNIQDAINYFNMYFDNGILYIHSDEELALEETGINNLEEATLLRQQLNDVINTMTDEEAQERAFLFPNWKTNTSYNVGTRVRYGGRIFKVLQAHTSQDIWTPTHAPSLFAQVLTDEETGEPTAWQQPTSTNPYMYGDKVIYNNAIYESIIDFNVWNPTDYPQGWNLIQDLTPQPDPNPQEEILDWVQPDASNPYNTGDKVRYNNQIYQSLIDNNVWSPEAYPTGWELIEE